MSNRIIGIGVPTKATDLAKKSDIPTQDWYGDTLIKQHHKDHETRNKHPAVLEAWERYQVLLKLHQE